MPILHIFRERASTGPRPRGRGMMDIKLPIYLHTLASTGPRPRGRGMSEAAPRERRPSEASTGPRPRGRGMATSRSSGSERRKRFNGAAPARARNVVLMETLPLRLTVASTGPRPRGRGMPMWVTPGPCPP